MERLDLTPRANWREDCEAVGFTYHSMDGVYWDEAHCYRFTAAQIDELEAATLALHELTLAAIEQIVAADIDNECKLRTDRRDIGKVLLGTNTDKHTSRPRPLP